MQYFNPFCTNGRITRSHHSDYQKPSLSLLQLEASGFLRFSNLQMCANSFLTVFCCSILGLCWAFWKTWRMFCIKAMDKWKTAGERRNSNTLKWAALMIIYNSLCIGADGSFSLGSNATFPVEGPIRGNRRHHSRRVLSL